MNQNWGTVVTDWQGVDDEPTSGSDNLVKSGGVAEKLYELEKIINPSVKFSNVGYTTYDFFDYPIKNGNHYIVKNTSSAICSFNTYSTKDSGSVIQTIYSLQPNESREFLATADASIVGGYFNSTDHKLEITSAISTDLARKQRKIASISYSPFSAELKDADGNNVVKIDSATDDLAGLMSVNDKTRLQSVETKLTGMVVFDKSGYTGVVDYFPFNLEKGKTYSLTNLSGGIINVESYNKSGGTYNQIESFSNFVEDGAIIVFTPNTDASYIGCMFNTVTHKIQINTDSIKEELDNIKSSLDSMFGSCTSFSSDSDGVFEYSFKKGYKYVIKNNSSERVNFSTRLTQNGETIDGVFYIEAGISETFVASADAKYLRHNRACNCDVIMSAKVVLVEDIKNTLIDVTVSKLPDGTFMLNLPIELQNDTAFVMQANTDKLKSGVAMPASSFSQLKTFSFNGKKKVVTLPASCARIQFSVIDPSISNISFTIRFLDTLDSRIEIVEDELDALGCNFLGIGMFESIGAIGDSFTAASVYHIVDGKEVYYKDFPEQSYIATIGKRNGVPFKNYGVGGSTAKTWMEDPNGLAKLNADEPCSFYFLAHGLNDQQQIAEGSLNLGTLSDIGTSVNTFYGNYSRLVSAVIAHAPKAKLCAVKLQLYYYSSVVYETNKAIEDVANHYGILCIDPLDDPYFKSNFFNKQIGGHPTCGGYCGVGLAFERLLSKAMMINPDYVIDANF